MRSFPVKENPISSEDSKILWYRQTNVLLLYYKDFLECSESTHKGGWKKSLGRFFLVPINLGIPTYEDNSQNSLKICFLYRFEAW